MLVILLIICFFCPFLKIGQLNFPISYLTLLIVGGKGLWDIVRKYKYSGVLIFFVIYLLYTCFSVLVHSLINSYTDFRGVLGAIMGLLAVGVSFYLGNWFAKLNLSRVLMSFNYPLLINNIIIILTFSSEAFKNVFYRIIAVNPRMLDYPVPRYSGLGYDGFSYASTLNAVFFLIIYFLVTTLAKELDLKSRILSYANLIITLICTILVGRTGVAMMLIGILLFFITDFAFSPFIKKIILFFKVIGSLLALSLIFLLLYNFILVDLPFFENFTYGFKVYSEFIETGQLQDSSLSDITNSQYFFPKTIPGILFGIGNFGRGLEYIQSDIGVVLATHGYGVLGLMLFLCCVFSFFYFCVKDVIGLNKILKLGTIAVLLVSSNSKDFYIFYPVGHYILLFTFLFYFKFYTSGLKTT